MKKVISTAIVLTLVLLLALPVLAADAGKYTPTIDGDKDEAYSQSFSFGIFDQESATKGEGWHSTSGDTATSMDATISYLWDDKFLYAFIEVITPTPEDAGKDFILDSDNPWESESVELWFLWTDLDDNSERMKISVDPFYNKSWGDGPYYEEVSAGSNAVAKLTDKGYNAEFAVALPAQYLKQGSQIKATLQVNDYSADGTVAVGQQIGDSDLAVVITLGSAIVIAQPEPEPEPEPEPAVEIPQPETPASVPATPSVPQTGDGIAVLLIMFAVSGASLITLRKKSK